MSHHEKFATADCSQSAATNTKSDATILPAAANASDTTRSTPSLASINLAIALIFIITAVVTLLVFGFFVLLRRLRQPKEIYKRRRGGGGDTESTRNLILLGERSPVDTMELMVKLGKG